MPLQGMAPPLHCPPTESEDTIDDVNIVNNADIVNCSDFELEYTQQLRQLVASVNICWSHQVTHHLCRLLLLTCDKYKIRRFLML